MVALALASMGAVGLSSCRSLLDLPSGVDVDPNLVCAEGGCRCRAGFDRCGDQTTCDTNLTLDAKHCGACGHDCRGGSCVDGLCTPLSLIGAENAGIAWYKEGSEIIIARRAPSFYSTQPFMTIPLSGAPVGGFGYEFGFDINTSMVVAGETTFALCTYGEWFMIIAFEDEDLDHTVYIGGDWGDLFAGATSTFLYFSGQDKARLCRVPRVGLPVYQPECVGGLSKVLPFRAVAAGETSYWASSKGILTWRDDAPTTTVLLPAEPGAVIQALNVVGDELYLVESFAPCPSGGSAACDRVSVIPTTGGARRVISVIPNEPHVWGDLPPNPPSEPPALEPRLMVDETEVYLFDGRPSGLLWRMPIEGGEAEVVGRGVFAAGEVLADEEWLYFTDNAAVYKLVKPVRRAP